MGLLLAGFADEAAKDLREQIAIHKQYGIQALEIRKADDVTIGQMNDKHFEEVCRIVREEEYQICGFGSAIANWARPITTDFQIDVDELRRSIPRMRKLNTNLIRVMSYPNDGLDELSWRNEVFRRLKELAHIAEEEDVIIGHENCDGWGAESPENLKILMQEIDSPALQVIFDTGNPVGHGGTTDDVWNFYQAAKPWICHFHIKDCYPDEQNKIIHCYPGEGLGDIRNIIIDLLKTGYRGYFSMEPHMAMQIHLSSNHPEDIDVRQIYEEYCRKTIQLIEDLRYA